MSMATAMEALGKSGVRKGAFRLGLGYCRRVRQTAAVLDRVRHIRPVTSSSSAMPIKDRLSKELGAIKAAGTWKSERVITSKQDVAVTVAGSPGPILNFCANNYLGLSGHPDVVQAGIEALLSHGAGLSSVRFICGTQNIHKDLEREIAKFHGKEDAILYASCFDANAGLFEQLLGPEDAVLSDALNHASIIDGIRLCKAKKLRYRHRDVEDIERKLQETQSCRTRLIATDGVFSMDGNLAPLPEICRLAEKYNALVFVDECHATGVIGETGKGTEEYFGLQGNVDIINSTLGKALGGASGGYTTGTRELVELLRQRSRPYLFSNSIPPAAVACAGKVLEMLASDSALIRRIAENTARFRAQMTKAGFVISGNDHPICPVMLGDARLASEFADEMLAKGIYVIGFSYPVVPKDQARIRVQITAAHSLEDIDRTVDAFVEIGRKKSVI